MKSQARLGSSGLFILMMAQVLPLIDFSIVNVALESISASLHAGHTGLELMVALYGVAFAVCLAMGGRLGDNYGRRRILNYGVIVFAIASLGCGAALNMPLLLAARVLQGVGAALIVPQILATIHVTLSGRAHSRALGIYGAVGGLAFVAGQVLGGGLVEMNLAGLGWRNVFLINLPLCLIFLAFSGRVIPETRSDQPEPVDWPGTFLLAAALICLLIPMALGPLYHWHPLFIGMLVLLIPLLRLLWQTEQKQQAKGLKPLLPPHLLQLPSIRYGMVLALLFFSCWSGFMFSVAVTLQQGAGMSAFESGNCFIALGLVYFAGSLLSTRVSNRIGPVNTLLTGCAIQIPGLLGLIWTFHVVWPHPGALNLLPATAIMGFGQSFIVSSFFRISLSQVKAEDAGAGSSVLTTLQQAAFGLGSALLGAIEYQAMQMGGNALDGVTAALTGEFVLMCLVVLSTLIFAWRQRGLTRAGAAG